MFAVPVPEVAIPDNIRRRQATQTIATAPEPSAWLLRTEWPAQLAADGQQQRSAPLPHESSSIQPCFVDPMKGSVMSQADCQERYPHMKMVSPFGSNALLCFHGEVVTLYNLECSGNAVEKCTSSVCTAVALAEYLEVGLHSW